ncbi:sulfatase [Anaerolineales bacterium HSG6]|nr:sulfatase [Anaerolineales bacterium HSG6]MDM8531917.1 sulfatase [Anaerolineales bacterium HSG25]
MRILYIDIDSLRPDHLGCYGYHRPTSPNIDELARQAVRFDNMYVSDAPCLPSRTALWSGRCGFRTGVVGHGGTTATPFSEGPSREFRDLFGTTGWMPALRDLGYKTITVSSFAERHSAWHWYAGFNEIYNPGGGGLEDAHEINAIAMPWLKQNGKSDNWFLHLNYWDPHTPYSVPESFGNPFEPAPLPSWLTSTTWQRGWDGYGPHSPQEPHGYGGSDSFYLPHHRFPLQLDSPEKMRQWINGYDVAIRYVDEHIGQIVDQLDKLGVLDETIIMIGADHGENQGELNVWGDHQTADHTTCRVPLIVRWPDLIKQARVDKGLYYQFDWMATMIELLGGQAHADWDGRPFTDKFRAGMSAGRDYLVVSQGAWACQRGIRFNYNGQGHICLQTYHDGHKMLEPTMLFNLTQDPHQQQDLSRLYPQLVEESLSYLADWTSQMIRTSPTNVDPLMTVLREGGPFHTRGQLAEYLERLKNTGRAHHAKRLAERHASEL